LHSRLVDATGQLDARYSLDGLHLTAHGYRVWLDHIAPYVRERSNRRVP
jgi:lysophospholipase L1-like esterase